jgi:DNA-binding SARP family transcriptional activator
LALDPGVWHRIGHDARFGEDLLPIVGARPAKLSRPRLRGAAARERLYRVLDAAREQGPAVCVVGPPGSGKTTVVASWLDARGLPGIWFQVDAGDADLATFFYYLGEAARPFSRKGMAPLPLLTPEYQADVEGFSRRFFRGLFSRMPNPATLVLDNYQEVSPQQAFHKLVAEAVADVPQGITLIVVSRRDPPDCYARLIANENVRFVEWDDLKLTLAEAQAIALKRGCGDAQRVRALHACADGWAAGFTLVLERGHGGVAPLHGAPDARQALFDYFASQIFAQVDESVRSFLTATAWLPSVSVPVAQALTGNAAAREILDDLYRRHLFVHRRRGDPPSYHYHALFRAFLQAQAAQRLEHGELKALKASAAALLEGAGEMAAAVELYRDSAAWDQVLRLLVSNAPQLIAQGRWKTLQELAAQLPALEVGRAPWLGYWLGRSKVGLTPAAARDDMLRALKAFEAVHDTLGQILCVTGAMETYWVESTGHERLDRWIDRALLLLSCQPAFPNAEAELRVLSIVMVAMSFRQPRNPKFGWTQARMQALIDSDLADEAKVLAGSVLVGQSLPGGDLALGQWVVDRVGTVADRVTISAVTRLMWLLRLACHHARAADYALALATFGEAEALSAREGLRAGEAMLCWWGGHISILADRPNEAERFAARLERSSLVERPFHLGILLNIRCMAALAQGRVQEALDHGTRALAIAKEVGVVWPRVWYALPTIFALLEAERYLEAAAEIEPLREYIAGTFVDAVEVELLLAEAYLAYRTGRLAQCHGLLRKALALAAEKSYVFLFRTSFRPHRLLFAEAFRAALDNDYLRRAVHRFRLRQDAAAGEHWPWRVKLYTLGRFELQLDGRSASFSRKTPRKPIALLKALAAAGGGPVPEHKLLDALWSDQEGDAARRALAMAAHRLRGLLGSPDTLISQDGGLLLNRELCWVDAFEAERLLAEGIEHAREGPGAALPDLAQRIGQLCRGRFLPADEDAPWTVSMRERIAALFVRFVTTAGAGLERDGRWDEAADWYRRGLEIDSLTESFYQGLMRCHLHAGRYADGLSAFRRMRQLLSITLGAQPSAASESLYRALQQR